MGRRILIVEDDEKVAGLLCDVLREAGCLVLGPACSIRSALRAIADHAVDAALLDVNLGGDERVFPVADVLSALRIPFVFVSAYSRYLMPFNYRACPHITKPFGLSEVVASLTKAVSGGPVIESAYSNRREATRANWRIDG
jgi:DNA-binding response OmpR family regulator